VNDRRESLEQRIESALARHAQPADCIAVNSSLVDDARDVFDGEVIGIGGCLLFEVWVEIDTDTTGEIT